MFNIMKEPAFRDHLLRSLRPLLVSPRETLMRQGEYGDEMYLITQGALTVDYTPSPTGAMPRYPGSWPHTRRSLRSLTLPTPPL